MISANEAKTISAMDPVERAIRNAAHKGQFSAEQSVIDEDVAEYKTQLEELGFVVNVSKAGFDIGDHPASLLMISWY